MRPNDAHNDTVQICSITLKLWCFFSVIVGETSVLPNVYRNSFAARTTMNHYTLRYSEKNSNEWVIGKRSCKSCSSSETAAWNNVTSLLDYDNVTVSNPATTIIRRPTYKIASFYYILSNAHTVVVSVVPLLSLVTNSLSIAVFSRMHRRINSELLLVFVCLSVVDTFALTLSFNRFVSRIISRKMSLTRYNVGCQVLNWLGGCGQVCSSYLVLLYTFERFISVRYPLKRAIICSARRVRIAVLCILVFIPASQIYYLFLFSSVGRSCTVRPHNKLLYGSLKLYIQFVLGMLLPYCCVAILNAMIVYDMIKYQRKRAALQASTTSSEDRTQRSMTLMLLTASTYSLVMVTPLISSRALNVRYTVSKTRMNSLRQFIFDFVAVFIISPWNYCGNFFFYFIGGRQFRKEFVDMLRCRQLLGKYRASDSATVHKILLSSLISLDKRGYQYCWVVNIAVLIARFYRQHCAQCNAPVFKLLRGLF